MLYVGTSGYSYKEWKGSFYPATIPAKDMLSYYASRLQAVELNNTFYRLPQKSIIESWKSHVPDNFRFTMKASQLITHFKKLKDATNETRLMLKRFEAFKDRMGAVLFRLPPDMKKDINRQAFGVVDTGGATGLLGNAGVTSASTTVTMASPKDVQYIHIGDFIDILVQATGATITNGSGREVVGRNVSAGTITLDAGGGNVTTSASHGVYLAGSRANEMDGLRHITAATGTLHSINRATAGNEFWRGAVKDAGGAVVGMKLAWDLADQRARDEALASARLMPGRTDGW